MRLLSFRDGIIPTCIKNHAEAPRPHLGPQIMENKGLDEGAGQTLRNSG